MRLHKITQLCGNTIQRFCLGTGLLRFLPFQSTLKFNVTSFVYFAPWKYHGIVLAGVAGELRAASAFEWSVATPGGTYPGLGQALAWLLFLRMAKLCKTPVINCNPLISLRLYRTFVGYFVPGVVPRFLERCNCTSKDSMM